jgi:phage protein D
LEQVCPGLVFETQDRDADGNETGEVTKGVNQSVLYMKAVKALQEAMERIEQLEASNADLLARVTALES